MSSAVIQLLVLAGIAIFLIIKLKNVLGTRDGFEKPVMRDDAPADLKSARTADLSVVEGGVDRDITDHVKAGSDQAKALGQMKAVEGEFNLTEFLNGAKGAYEMILMAFERGDLASVLPFMSKEVYASLSEAIDEREKSGLKIEATFVGIRELAVADATFDEKTQEAELSVRFVGETTSVVRDKTGTIVEGNPNEIKSQRDVWTFARVMGSNNPNWQLVATGE